MTISTPRPTLTEITDPLTDLRRKVEDIRDPVAALAHFTFARVLQQ